MRVLKTLSKYRVLYVLSILVIMIKLFGIATADAHQQKSYDSNGGHYDNFGNYHCHQQPCKKAPSRNQFRRSSFTSPSDMEKFFHADDWPYWLSSNGNCQSSRTQVLVLTSIVPVRYTNPRQCEVREGLWLDPYTGEEFKRAAQLEIDHVISPHYANSADGYQWDDATRASFSNDLLNLVPVSRAIHRKKRHRSIASWQPRDEFLCEYAANWQDIAGKYDLDIYARDKNKINTILDGCTVKQTTGELDSPSQ